MSAEHTASHLPPSEWVVRWAPRIAAGTVLDMACGGGRHALYLLALGLKVVAVDRERRALVHHRSRAPVDVDVESVGKVPRR